jgi:hypothetical protein
MIAPAVMSPGKCTPSAIRDSATPHARKKRIPLAAMGSGPRRVFQSTTMTKVA